MENNYLLHGKWTLIRDITGVSVQKYLSYNSHVVDMDSFTTYQAVALKETISKAMEKGMFKISPTFLSKLILYRHMGNALLQRDSMKH